VINSEPHGFARVAWLVVAMTMATVPFLDLLPPWETLALIVLATWRLVTEHRGLVVVPMLPVRLLLVLVIGVLLLVTGNLGFGLAAATPLFVALLWSKLLELKARRDYLVACVLCYFLVAVLLFDRQSLMTCLYAIATLGAITIALVSYHLDGSAHRSFRLGTRLILQGLPLAAAIFVLFPRLQVNFPNLGGQAVTGFTNSLTPGDVARIALSDEPVMRVEFPDGDMPPADQRYWRGLVLSQTDGATWKVAPATPVYEGSPVAAGNGGRAVVQDISLQPINQRWLFALDVAEEPPEKTRLGLNRTLIRRHAPVQVLRYRVTSRLGELPNDTDDLALQIPTELDPRIVNLAQQWRAGARSPQEVAARGAAWFAQQGFTYSLSPGTMDAGVAEFLFERRTGFCAHYATSFALVLRVAGVPARVVVGFRDGERNDIGDFLLVRYDHAHAWCEVRHGDGWHRYDPTKGIPAAPGETAPAARRAGGGDALAASERAPSWLPAWLRGPYARINQWLTFVDAKWESNIMGLDGAKQGEWLGALGLQRLGNWLLLGLIVCALGAAVVTFVMWSRLRPTRQRNDPMVELYAQFCERLAQGGVVRRPNEGPRDFTTRAALALPAAAESIRMVGTLYEQLRYGRPDTVEGGLARLRQAIRAVPRVQPPTAHPSADSGGG
jgi:protein-glutamine gamma-glutamyltransferase